MADQREGAAKAVPGQRSLPQIDAQGLIAKLQEIADAPVHEPIRASDKIAAVREIGRLAGLYRDDRADRDRRPLVTNVAVVLDRGEGGTATETRRIVEGGTPLPPAVHKRFLGHK